MMRRTTSNLLKGVLLFFLALSSPGSMADPPPTINIHGTLQDTQGAPLTGVRDYRVRFFDSGTEGSSIAEVSGTTTLTTSGRFSLAVDPPEAALDAGGMWYELAIDQGADGIDPNDIFPERVRVHSVPFALRSQDSELLGGFPASEYLTTSSVGSNAWSLIGNSGTSPGVNYLGTNDDQPLDLVVNGTRVLELSPGPEGPNVVGGYWGNQVPPGVSGATIAGGGAAGLINSVTEDRGFIGGGVGNTAGLEATVGGGGLNRAVGPGSMVGGGGRNLANSIRSTISGGYVNRATADFSTVGGGQGNTATGESSTIGGGDSNRATRRDSTVGGGIRNTARGDSATIAGGEDNYNFGTASAIGGGARNTAIAQYSMVGGGSDNAVSARNSVIAGGRENTVTGLYASVPGGFLNSATGDYSFAAGRRSQAEHDGSFVWADNTNEDFTSTADNEFAVRAGGGVRLQTEKLTVGPARSYIWISGNGVRKFHNSDTTIIDMGTKGDAIIQRGSAPGKKNVMLPIAIPGTLYGQDVRIRSFTLSYKGETGSDSITAVLLRRQTGLCDTSECYEVLRNYFGTLNCDGSSNPNGCEDEFVVWTNHVQTSQHGILYMTIEMEFSSATSKIWIGGVRFELEHD